MATYAIGDIQGCYEPLQRLLQHIAFNPQQDTLWLAGDLINRGPQNLEVLRFIKSLGNAAKVILGNHDLHLLAIYYGGHSVKKHDTITDILTAADCAELLAWLKAQPLVIAQNQYCMSHAGIPPQWQISQALAYAAEVQQAMLNAPADFFQHMYGNQSNLWSDDLCGQDRLRTIVNYLTRMRFINAQGELDFASKEGLNSAPTGFFPWFTQARKSTDYTLLFGHWAALEGHTGQADIIALDTGCVWGGQLSAYCLESQQKFSVPA